MNPYWRPFPYSGSHQLVSTTLRPIKTRERDRTQVSICHILKKKLPTRQNDSYSRDIVPSRPLTRKKKKDKQFFFAGEAGGDEVFKKKNDNAKLTLLLTLWLLSICLGCSRHGG